MAEYNLPDLDDDKIPQQIAKDSKSESNSEKKVDSHQPSTVPKNIEQDKEIDRGLFCLKNDILYNWMTGKHLISTHVLNSEREKRSLKESYDMNTVLLKMNKYIETQFPDDINPETEMQVRSKYRSPFVFYLVHGNKEQEILIEISFNQGYFTGNWKNFSFSSQDFFKFIDTWRINLLKYFRKKYNKTKLILIKPPEKIILDYQIIIKKD